MTTPSNNARVEGPGTWLYLACLGAIGGGAILHLLRSLWLPVPYFPVVKLFEEPIAAFIAVLHLKPLMQFGALHVLERFLSFGLALGIALLVFRRASWMRQSGSISAPSSFSGFPLGLAWAAVALSPVLVVLASMAFPVDGELVVVLAFLAYAVTEMTELRESRKGAAGSGDQAPATIAEVPRRRPVCTFVSIALPVLGAILMVLLQTVFGSANLGTFVLGLVALAALCALGLVATVIAVVRKERWVPAQVIGFLTNFLVTSALGLGVLAEVFRFG